MEKERKPRKKYPRETTVRFNTDEAKVLLMAMNYSVNRDVFFNEGGNTIQRAGKIINRLKYRIEEERKKKNKISMEVKSEEVYSN